MYDFWGLLNLTYPASLPFLVLINLFYIIILDINKIVMFIIFVFISGSLQSLRIIILTGKLRYFHAVFYPIIYYFVMLPGMLYSFIVTLICFPDNEGPQKMWQRVFHGYIWIFVGGPVLIGLGIFYNLLVQKERLASYLGYMLIAVVAILFVLAMHWISWGWYVLIPENKEKQLLALNIKQTDITGSSRELKAEEKY